MFLLLTMCGVNVAIVLICSKESVKTQNIFAANVGSGLFFRGRGGQNKFRPLPGIQNTTAGYQKPFPGPRFLSEPCISPETIPAINYKMPALGCRGKPDGQI